jgi:membrane protein
MVADMWQKLIEGVDAFLARAEADGRPVLARVARMARMLLMIWRQLVVDDALITAQSLAFTTILSMVPALAVVFAIFKAFVPSDEFTEKVSGWLLGTLFAESVGEVTGVLQGFLERVDIGAVGAVGFIFLIVTAVSTFMSVESAFNRIWRLPATRPMHWRLTSYYAVITLAPALLGLAFFVAGWLQDRIGNSVGTDLVSLVASVTFEALALTLMYKLLPHGQVRWKAAAIGGITAGIGFEVSRAFFNLYVGSIYTGSVPSRIYGSFALIPVFFLWIYLVWVIVLFGVELAYLVQNRAQLTAAVMGRRGTRRGVAPSPPTGYLLTRVLIDVARRFRDGSGPVDPVVVAQRLQLEPDEVVPAVRLLCEAGYLLSVEEGKLNGLVPGQPLERVTVGHLYRLCEMDGYQVGQLPDSPGASAGEAIMTAARDARAAALSATIASLLPSFGEVREAVSTPPPPELPPAGEGEAPVGRVAALLGPEAVSETDSGLPPNPPSEATRRRNRRGCA